MPLPHPFLSLLAVVATCGCAVADGRGDTLRYGEAWRAGADSARGWVALSGDAVQAVGVTLTDGVLARLRRDTGALVLGLPPDVARAGYDHAEVAWVPGAPSAHGHPVGSHLAIHFYLVTPAERRAMTDTGLAAQVPELDLVPVGYVPVPDGGGPGTHWDAGASRPAGRSRLLYGFYAGELVFLEVALADDAAPSRRPEVAEPRHPRRFARTGAYPTRSTVRYAAGSHERSIALEGLVRWP